MEKQGWEIRVESDNKNGTHARDLLEQGTLHLCPK